MEVLIMWKICAGYSKYEVNETGEIRNIKTMSIVKQTVDRSGYLTCRLYADDGRQTTVYVHRIVLSTFNPNSDRGRCIVNHKNGIKTDPSLGNLEWVSTIENIHHAGENYLSPKCRPVEIRRHSDYKIFRFPSAIDCSRFLNEPKDVILFRLNHSLQESVLWDNGFQYRWKPPIFKNWKPAVTKGSQGKSRYVQVKDMEAKKIHLFSSQKDAAVFLNRSMGWISSRLRKDPQLIYCKRYQLQYYSPDKW